MKLFLLLITILFISCTQSEEPGTPPANTLTEPIMKVREIGARENLRSINKAIKTFHAGNGRYPESLEELAEKMMLDIDASLYDYDQESGVVSAVE